MLNMALRKIILYTKKVINFHIYAIKLQRNECSFVQSHFDRALSTGILNRNKNVTLQTTNQPLTTFDVNEFKRINFTGTKYLYLNLQKIFNISTVEAKALITMNPRFRKCTNEMIDRNYKLYQSEGISHDIIRKYLNILTLPDAEDKIKIIKNLSIDLNKTAPLLMATVKILKKMVREAESERSQVPYGSRIILLSKKLDVPEWEISERLTKHTYVYRIPLYRLEENLNILLKYGVEKENVLNDFWVLRYSPDILETRLKAAIEADVLKVKAWMVRCTDSVFERCISRQIENRKILDSYASVEDYLSKRLECSIENAKYLTEKYPAIEKMSTSKMKEMIDYLYEQGYTPDHLCRVPRILAHSLETTKSRINQLKEFGFFQPSLAILCKSKRDYDKYLKKYFKKETEGKNS